MATSNGQDVSSGMDEAVQNFMSITGADEQQAHFCIEACGGDVERALQMFIGPDMGGATQGLHPQAPINHQGNHGGNENGGGNRGPNQGGLMGGVMMLVRRVVGLPVQALQTSVGLLGGFLSFSVGGLVTFVLPQRIRDAYQQTNQELDPIRQAREFLLGFENAYGSEHPEFVEDGWKEAAAQAHRDCKFLWVYIHSPDHEDTESFCREVLCSAEVVQFLNSKFLCWGGDIRRSQAFTLSSKLGATTFPYMCLLAFSGSRLQLVSSAQGKLSATDVIQVLQQAIDEQGALMVAEQSERNQMEVDRRLREEQDREYMEAQEMDRAREQQRENERKERERKEEEKKKVMEMERLKREEEAQRKADHEAAVARRKKDKQHTLQQEPEAGSEVSQLRIRLPDGSTHNRRFLYSATVQDVYDFVDSLENLACLDYTLVTGFPRTFLGQEKLGIDLCAAGLVPGGTLMVQSNDDD